jgi:hypothetical protein
MISSKHATANLASLIAPTLPWGADRESGAILFMGRVADPTA